jgi:hypothetical protein
MADEAVTTDTTQSQTNDAPADAALASQSAETSTADDGDGTVLGGPIAEEASEAGAEADQAEAAPTGAPEKYEFTPPEGVDLDTAMVAEAEPVLRELNLSNESANKLLPVAARLVSQTQEKTMQALIEAGSAQRKEWLDAFKADPDIGGAKAEETTHLAAKGLDALGYVEGHPFRKALTESGFGNHPDMIRAFRRIGEMVGEDGLVRSDTGARTQEPAEARWYGKKGD